MEQNENGIKVPNRNLSWFIIRFIIGAVISTAICCFLAEGFSTLDSKSVIAKIFSPSGVKWLVLIPFGTVGFVLVKLYHRWIGSKWRVKYSRNILGAAFVTYIVDPLIGIGGFMFLGWKILSLKGFFPA